MHDSYTSHNDGRLNDGSLSSIENPGTQPLVSIVTPVFNGEKYLSECIPQSCINLREFYYIVIMLLSSIHQENALDLYEQHTLHSSSALARLVVE